MMKNEVFKRLIFVPVTCFVMLFLMVGYTVLDVIGFWNRVAISVPVSAVVDDAEDEQNPLKNVRSPEKVKPGAKLIDINNASAEEFMRLPGIGAVRAGEIVRQRKKMQGFYSVDDLACTDGIGTKTLDKLREFITVSEYKGEE